MKRCATIPFVLSVVFWEFVAFSQTFKTLHDFSDGDVGSAFVLVAGQTLYGTTSYGGAGSGNIFVLNTDGTGYTNLHLFPGGIGGGRPYPGLVLSATTLYGATEDGGDSGMGMLFSVNTDGTAFDSLYSFLTMGMEVGLEA